ncbi:DUF1592 domain-containing protein [Allorhodopirellula solitaria]|nr:DUF1592 domain-containing protein [Allorhodopirellula solitaria]
MKLRSPLQRLFAGALLTFAIAGPSAAEDSVITPEQPSGIGGFFSQHCLECHGPDTAEADIRLDRIPLPTQPGPVAQTWTRVLEVIESGEMPPAGMERPKPDDIDRVLDELGTAFADSWQTPSTSLRRMNRREYENIVHDLLGIDAPLADVLPEDSSVQGFDNVSDGLSISAVLMERYLEAADTAFDATIRRIKPLPPATRRAEMMQVKDNIDAVKKKKGGVIEVDGSFVDFTPGWPPVRIDPAHPIEPGRYRCRVAVWPHNPNERTLAVALFVGPLFGPGTQTPIGVFDVTGTSSNPRIIEFTADMEAGETIHIRSRIWPEHVTWRDKKKEDRPGIGIAWAETYGPLDQSFPSAAQQRLFGDSPTIELVPAEGIYLRHRKGVKRHVVTSSDPRVDAARIIDKLARRAFRRPLRDEEVLPFVELAWDRLAAGRSFEQAVRAGVTAVLCSPQFLLLNENPTGNAPSPADRNRIDPFALASRLSYFLWSSMPDEELLKLASNDQLSDPKTFAATVDRMLADQRRERFVDNFTGQWLDLRDIEFTTPDKRMYPEFDPLLQVAMLSETRHFFRYLLDHDSSVLHFIDSDFTFLNERLARHYGIPGVKGHEEFRKVELPETSIRGGLLTQASILKVTANGTSTSPVLRGVWVQDRLLAQPLPPPPPGIPAVEPDIRGATTIRQQLAKHTEIGTCATCHRRIDPAGFALERFDAIGGQRQWYRAIGGGDPLPGKLPYAKGPDLDLAATLPDGRSFENFREFRACLLANEEAVARAIATKLLVYATGRPLSLADRATIDSIVESTRGHRWGLRSMIHAVTTSDLFWKP